MISRDALAAALGQTEREWELQGPQQPEERELRLRRSQEQQKQDAKLQAQRQQTLLKATKPTGDEQCQGVLSTNQMFAARGTQGNMEGEQFHGDPAAALLQKYREKFEELQNSFLSLRNERATLREQHTALIEEHRSVEESLQRIAAEVEDLKSRESADASSTAFLAHFIAAALRCFLETAASGGSVRDVMRGLRSEMEALQMPNSSDPRLLSCYTRLKKCATGLRSAAADGGKEAQGKSPEQQKQDGGAPAQQQEVSKQQPQKPSEDAAAVSTPQKEQDEQQKQQLSSAEQQQSSAEHQQQHVEPPEQQKGKELCVGEDKAEASRSLLQTPSAAEDDTVSIRRRYTSPHGAKRLSSALHICGLPEAARRRSATALGSGTVLLAAQFAAAARAPVPREEHTPMLLSEVSQEQQQQQQENTGTTAIKAFCTWPRPSCPPLTGGKSMPKAYADVAQERQDNAEQQQQESKQFEEQGLQQPSPSATHHAFASHGESTEAHLPGTDRRGSREGSAAFPFLSRSAAPRFSVNSTNSCSSLAASPVSPVSSFFLPPPASLPGSAERKAILPRAAAGAAKKSAWQRMAGAADRRSMMLQTQQLQQQLTQLQLQLQHLEMHLQQQTLGNFVRGGHGEEADVETADSVAATAAEERRSCSDWLSVPRRSRRQEHLRQKQQQEAGLTGVFSPFAAAANGSFGGRKSTLSRSSSAYSSTEALDGSSGMRSLDLESCCSCSSAAAFPRRPSRGSSGHDCSHAEERRTTKTQSQHEKQQPEQSSRRSSGIEGGVGCLQDQQQRERSRSSCSGEQQPKALRSSSSSSGRRESNASTIPSVFQHLAEQQKQQHNDPRLRHPHYRLRSPLQRREHPPSGEKQQEEFQRWRMQPQHRRWQQGQQQGRCWDPRDDESEDEAWRWGLIEPCPSRKEGSGGTLNSVSSPAGVPLSSCASAGALGTGGLLAVRRTILELERQKKSEEQQQKSPSIVPQSPCSQQRPPAAQQRPSAAQQRPSAAQQQRQQGHWSENDEADKTCALQEALRRQEEALLQQQTTARQLQKALQQQQEALKAAAVGATVATEPNGNPARVIDSAGALPEAAATAAAEIAAFHAKSRQQQLEEVWLRVTQLQAQIIANTENPWLLQQLMLVPGSTNRAALGKCETLRGYTVPSTRL